MSGENGGIRERGKRKGGTEGAGGRGGAVRDSPSGRHLFKNFSFESSCFDTKQ